MSKSTSPQPPFAYGASSSLVSNSSSVADGRSKSKSPAVKPPNVFSNDGSFLDRIRRSMQEEDDKKKETEALERKKNFADRFKNRRKRPAHPQDPLSNSDVIPEEQENPTKKLKLVDGKEISANADDKHASAQAKYHKAVDSYPSSLKDSGTGVRPLVK
ncbi:hypothetical protein CPB84DRAFT_122963 [Gymnopilus junonius]|uniref:Uncharacterized protein n=1 Tax=Gymnopilus junonius TaxID=109634 RepID=A0A9P5NG45_GYMJU|nr:hypothetical protein CPB84DRAFT_122963 [Gymnopilus junonius]